MFQNLPTISKWLIHVSKLAYDFKIIGTMTKLRQVSEPIFAARNFMHRRQVDIIPPKSPKTLHGFFLQNLTVPNDPLFLKL